MHLPDQLDAAVRQLRAVVVLSNADALRGHANPLPHARPRLAEHFYEPTAHAVELRDRFGESGRSGYGTAQQRERLRAPDRHAKHRIGTSIEAHQQIVNSVRSVATRRAHRRGRSPM
ncbi:hypothetical protein CBA19CS22_13850 [Caballeronia novacaledonica]|uniref:Uncharacterized protein n=1 Tax=Caballeronia novacaledonica TaxID=1544861 RepID=A0ACB5QR09_9BURK|nr:hypothetical protein CBA19CS22_13850 [Caballeronia novacaledonica]